MGCDECVAVEGIKPPVTGGNDNSYGLSIRIEVRHIAQQEWPKALSLIFKPSWFLIIGRMGSNLKTNRRTAGKREGADA